MLRRKPQSVPAPVVAGAATRLLRGLFLGVAVVLASAMAQAAVSVDDDTGTTVRLPEPARRIVSLAPHLTELLFEAGAGERVVGVVAYSDYPEQARRLPRIGDARALDLEAIAMLQPDLVVAWASGSPKGQVERLKRMGLPVFLNEPDRLEAIARTIERLGILAGSERSSRLRAESFRLRLSELRRSTQGARRVRVFYQVWGEPLLTVNARHVIDDALGVCGADNVFAHLKVGTPRLDREAVLLADPDAIVIATSGDQGEALAAWTQWRSLRAVRGGHLSTVDPSLLHRHTSRILDGVAALCRHIARVR